MNIKSKICNIGNKKMIYSFIFVNYETNIRKSSGYESRPDRGGLVSVAVAGLKLIDEYQNEQYSDIAITISLAFLSTKAGDMIYKAQKVGAISKSANFIIQGATKVSVRATELPTQTQIPDGE